MKIERHDDCRVTIEFSTEEARKLADELVEQTGHLPNVGLEMVSLLRQAQYERRDRFRQPEGVWNGGIIYPKV